MKEREIMEERLRGGIANSPISNLVYIHTETVTYRVRNGEWFLADVKKCTVPSDIEGVGERALFSRLYPCICPENLL